MKTHIATLLEKFDFTAKYQPKDGEKHIEAVAMIVALDIIKSILDDKDLGKSRIDLVKRLAAVYEIDMPV